MKFTYPFIITLLLIFNPKVYSDDFSCNESPDGTIWCDDFENDIPMSLKYFEYGDNDGDFVVITGVGRNGSKGMRVIWQKGEVGAGGFKKSFGKTPHSYIGKNASSPDSSFNEIYWRMDVKHQSGWQGGGPAKLSRALCLANANWATGAMAHIWSGGKDNLYLGMDPASGISESGQLVSTKYNDFDNLRWLGFKSGTTDIFSTENSGQWYCIEAHIRLNTPGMKDGVFEFWIDDELQAGTYNLNWHGDYNSNKENMTINAVFFENYWNQGSPVEQERYFDNIVISTKRIGCNIEQTDINEESIDELVVYPNPADDYIYISNSNDNLNHFSIYDIRGCKLQEGDINNRIMLDVREFKPGAYYLILEGNSEKRFIPVLIH